MIEGMDAQTLVRRLKSQGMTQARIAAEIGCVQSEVSRWQNGKTKPMGEALLRLIALCKKRGVISMHNDILEGIL
jgi:transcriptional regulator with XRE-family HTH domain